MSEPKYPDVEVQLTGEDGNVFMIIGRVRRAIRQEAGREAQAEFDADVLSCGSYNDVLNKVQEWVSVS